MIPHYHSSRNESLSKYKKNSLFWWYYKGNQNLWNSGVASILQTISIGCVLFALLFLIKGNNNLALYPFYILFAILVFVEFYAWIYAVKNRFLKR